MFRKAIIAFSAIALIVCGFAGAETAEAATDISRGGSCSVSLNWSIATSVNFNNTSGSPSRGTVDYVVINSPGRLIEFHITHYGVSGQVLKGYGDSLPGSYRDTSKPGYVYRIDPSGDNSGTRRVVIDAESYTGVWCSEYSQASTIYSAN